MHLGVAAENFTHHPLILGSVLSSLDSEEVYAIPVQHNSDLYMPVGHDELLRRRQEVLDYPRIIRWHILIVANSSFHIFFSISANILRQKFEFVLLYR